MRWLSLLLAIVMPGCTGGRVFDAPHAIRTLRLTADVPVLASVRVKNIDGVPVTIRLYRVPTLYAAQAASGIAGAKGVLGRWAAIPVASADLADGGTVTLSSNMTKAGDLVILAVDPRSAGRFTFSRSSISVDVK